MQELKPLYVDLRKYNENYLVLAATMAGLIPLFLCPTPPFSLFFTEAEICIGPGRWIEATGRLLRTDVLYRTWVWGRTVTYGTALTTNARTHWYCNMVRTDYYRGGSVTSPLCSICYGVFTSCSTNFAFYHRAPDGLARGENLDFSKL